MRLAALLNLGIQRALRLRRCCYYTELKRQTTGLRESLHSCLQPSNSGVPIHHLPSSLHNLIQCLLSTGAQNSLPQLS